jgi:hypothetical protein
MTYSGEFGGKVLRGFKGDGKSFIAGATLQPEDVLHWPLANRNALHVEGKIDWFGPPAEEEQVARQSGSPAPKRGVSSRVPKTEVATKTTAKETTSAATTPARSRRAR